MPIVFIDPSHSPGRYNANVIVANKDGSSVKIIDIVQNIKHGNSYEQAVDLAISNDADMIVMWRDLYSHHAFNFLKEVIANKKWKGRAVLKSCIYLGSGYGANITYEKIKDKIKFEKGKNLPEKDESIKAHIVCVYNFLVQKIVESETFKSFLFSSQISDLEECLKESGADLPKGWTEKSLLSFAKSLTGMEGYEEGFFDACVEKISGKVEDPEAFCAALKDKWFLFSKAKNPTKWRGKGKSEKEVKKDTGV